MADALPRFIVLKSHSSGLCAYYTNRENDIVTGYIRCDEKSVFSPYAKIEVEPSKSPKYSGCFHLRFCYSNRYFGLDPTKNDYLVVARSNQPVEDPYERSCTLFVERKHRRGWTAGAPIRVKRPLRVQFES